MRRYIFSFVVAGVMSVVGAHLRAQTDGARFDVASVKVSAPNETTVSEIQAGGRFVARHLPIAILLELAFRPEHERPLPFSRMDGLPDWARTEFYDVVAKAATETDLPLRPAIASDELRPLLQSLFADRLKLRAHMAPRSLPVYKIVKGTQLGTGLKVSALDCAAQDSRCGANLIYGTRPRLTATGATLQQIAAVLPQALARPVVDETGLDGRYDVVLQWSRGQDQPGDPRYAADVTGIAPQFDVSLFTAIRDQLGLRLEPGSAPVDVLVIDHIERPTED